MRTIDRWRVAGLVASAVTAVGLTAGATQAGAQEPPTSDTTASSAAPLPASMDCTGALADVEHTFSVDDTIETGDTFDDPGSDFSVTFTRVDYVTDHVELTFEASHPIAEVTLGLDGTAAFQRAYFYAPGEPPELTFDAVLPPLPGEVTQATFCFVDAEAIGAQVDPTPPVTGTVPDPAMTVTVPDASNPTGEPIPAATPGPIVTVPAGGTLPKTGNDAVPVALAGMGLAAVGGGLLLGRRLRRTGA